MLRWDKLLCSTRRKDLHAHPTSMGVAVGRTESERDFDRVLFAAPTRRLADKTQVFPMEENDSVRTRLTHSHEVSNLARSIGVRLAFDHADEVFGADHERLQVKRVVPAMLAAVGLAHDLGNPPFGHQGETAIQQWFQGLQQADGVEDDFLGFDGNAQTFRLLTRLQILNDDFGLNLTLGTLAALIKYPSIYGAGDKFGYKKHGIFWSEREIVQEVWQHTGLCAGLRHPLAYVMEACDDIAYSVIDAEDTVKKGYASFYDLVDFLQNAGGDDPAIAEVVETAKSKNNEYKKEKGLSSRELNDMSMQMFRVKAIAVMVESATETFVANVHRMMDGSIDRPFELIGASRSAQLCKATKAFDRRYGFGHPDVLRLELMGNNAIKNLMTILWRAISNGNDHQKPFERYVFGDISENYRRVFEATEKTEYHKRQLLCDAVSGMTESYLLKRSRNFAELDSAPAKT